MGNTSEEMVERPGPGIQNKQCEHEGGKVVKETKKAGKRKIPGRW